MGEVREIPLSALGLETCAQAANRRGRDPATVRRWVNLGWLPAVVVGSGRTAVYLVRVKDVDGFTPPQPGPRIEAKPTAKKKTAPKPRRRKSP